MGKKYDSTVARMAGNIAAGMMGNYSVIIRLLGIEEWEGGKEPTPEHERQTIAAESVALARAIISEVERTELVATSAVDVPIQA